jgi:pyruvate dehydrogenase E2 component (dihydrolipoamide acetyltransferase)
MARIKEFALPDLGEGLTEGEILQWLVAVGDRVVINQPICEVETAKAAVELPSPYAGVVAKLFHDAGATVDVGQPIISFDTAPDTVDDEPAAAPGDGAVDSREALAVGDAVPSPAPEAALPAEDGPLPPDATPGGRTAVLVGYGPRTVSAKRRPRKEAPTQPARVSAAAVGAAAERLATTARAKAKPPIRRMARQYGLDIDAMAGSGPGGAVTRDDVENAMSAAAEPRTARDGAATEERIAVHGVRKLTAEAMVRSAFTAPHVTEFVSVDVTETMRLRADLSRLPEFAQVKVSPLLFVAKALINAVRRTPMLNSTWDDAAQEIVVKHYVNLGIAAATPRGLLVPNVKNAEQLSLGELAQELQDLTQTAREGRTTPADMQRGTITITNVGVFGVDGGTPIINPGESAILCVGAVRDMPWVHRGKVAIRQVTQLSLSFDHRVVDGELGSRFLSDIARQLESPANLLAWS